MAFRADILKKVMPLPIKAGIFHDSWIGIMSEFYGYKSLFIYYSSLQIKVSFFTLTVVLPFSLQSTYLYIGPFRPLRESPGGRRVSPHLSASGAAADGADDAPGR